MAKAVKGCMNPECVANQKKTNFSLNNDYCPKCGHKLSYVCKDCRMELDDDTRRYCVRCENKRRDNREQLGKVFLDKLGEGAKVVGGFAADTGKKVGKAVGDVAEDIKEGTERMIDKAKESRNRKDLQIPEEYKKLNEKAPDLGFPSKDAAMYGINNGQYSAIIVKAIVPPEVAMSFDNAQGIIDDWHKNMPENGGLIEVKNGETKNGNPFVYFIMKHSLSVNDVPRGNEYTMNINVKIGDVIYFINSSFAEEGTTGMRDAMGFELFRRANPDFDSENPFDGWSCDPYDPEFKEGFLMNRSEIEQLDEHFPEHPLSKARKFIKYIIENN